MWNDFPRMRGFFDQGSGTMDPYAGLMQESMQGGAPHDLSGISSQIPQATPRLNMGNLGQMRKTSVKPNGIIGRTRARMKPRGVSLGSMGMPVGMGNQDGMVR